MLDRLKKKGPSLLRHMLPATRHTVENVSVPGLFLVVGVSKCQSDFEYIFLLLEHNLGVLVSLWLSKGLC